MLSATADGWAFLRLLRHDVGIHCLTIFLCDWAYTGELSSTLIAIVTLKATILHFIVKALNQVTVSVWHILALGLTWIFSLFLNSLAHMLRVWMNFCLLACWCIGPAHHLLQRLQDMFGLILSLALVELYWETGIQTSYKFLHLHKPDWIDLMPRRELWNPHFLIILILIYLVRSKAECKICCLTIDLKLLYTKSSKGQKFNAECTVRAMFYEHK